MTRGDAKKWLIQCNVVAEVAADKSAIGYVSMGALKEATGIKVLAVANDTPLDVETKKRGTHPLSRSFYMAYYETDKELNQEFTFCQRQRTRNCNRAVCANCKGRKFFQWDKRAPFIVDGSTSVAPLMEMIAEEYMLQKFKCRNSKSQSRTPTKGIDSAINDADFAISSRIKRLRKELLDYEMIAKEGIAVINEETDVETITTEQLKSDLYRKD